MNMNNIPFPDVYKLKDDKISINEICIADKKYYSFSQTINDWSITIVIGRLFNIKLSQLHYMLINLKAIEVDGVYLFNTYDDASAAATMLTLLRC